MQTITSGVACSFQNWNSVCGQSWNGSKDRTVKEDAGFGLGIWSLLACIAPKRCIAVVCFKNSQWSDKHREVPMLTIDCVAQARLSDSRGLALKPVATGISIGPHPA